MKHTPPDLIKDLSASLTQTRTLAAMNLVLSKFRCKFHYDKKANLKHFRQEELIWLIKSAKNCPMGPKFELFVVLSLPMLLKWNTLSKKIKFAWKLIEYIMLFEETSIICKHNLLVCLQGCVVNSNLTSPLFGINSSFFLCLQQNWTKQTSSYFAHHLNNSDF